MRRIFLVTMSMSLLALSSVAVAQPQEQPREQPEKIRVECPVIKEGKLEDKQTVYVERVCKPDTHLEVDCNPKMEDGILVNYPKVECVGDKR